MHPKTYCSAATTLPLKQLFRKHGVAEAAPREPRCLQVHPKTYCLATTTLPLKQVCYAHSALRAVYHRTRARQTQPQRDAARQAHAHTGPRARTPEPATGNGAAQCVHERCAKQHTRTGLKLPTEKGSPTRTRTLGRTRSEYSHTRVARRARTLQRLRPERELLSVYTNAGRTTHAHVPEAATKSLHERGAPPHAHAPDAATGRSRSTSTRARPSRRPKVAARMPVRPVSDTRACSPEPVTEEEARCVRRSGAANAHVPGAATERGG